MAEVIAHILIILGNPLAHGVGKLIFTILSLGKLSIEPLPTKYPAHFVQAFDENKILEEEQENDYLISYQVALSVGYFVILCGFSFILYYFRDIFIAAKLPE